MNRIENGKPLLFFDDKTALHAITHISIFSNGVIDVCENNNSGNHSFHFGDSQPYTWDDVIEAASMHIGKEPIIIHLPLRLVKKYNYQLYIETKENKYGTLTVDTSQLSKLCGSSPSHVSLQDGLRTTVINLKKNLEGKSTEEFDDFCDLIFLENIKYLKGILPTNEYEYLERYICNLSDEDKKRIYKKRFHYLYNSYVYRMKEMVKGILKKFNYYG